MAEKLTRDQIRVAGKFILVQLAELVCDTVGRPKYVANLDNVVEDIFGYKKLATKISACRNDSMMIGVVLDFGLKDLFAITDNARMMAVLSDLVTMDRSLASLRKQIKKSKKSDVKKLQKEYNYINELYKKTVKTLRKELGLSAKNPYKNQFQSARDFVDSESEYSIFDDSVYGRSIYVTDDDDDDDDESLFTQFVERTSRKSKRRQTNPNSHMYSCSKDDGFEHLLGQIDDDDDDDEDDAVEVRRSGGIPSTTRIETKLDHLVSAVQQLINVGMTKPVIPNVVPQVPPTASSDIAAYLTTVSQNESAILDAVTNLTRKVTQNDRRFTTLAEAVGEIIQMLNSVDDEDEDDVEEPRVPYDNPIQKRREKFATRSRSEEYAPGEQPLSKDEIADIMLRAETQPVVGYSKRSPADQLNDVTTAIPVNPQPAPKTGDSPAAVFNQTTVTTHIEAPVSHPASETDVVEQDDDDVPIAATEPSES